MKNITFRTWSILVWSGCIATLFFIIFVNYILDTSGYFLKTHYGRAADNALSVRDAKITYIKNNPELYTGFIIGGSRTGVLDPAIAGKYTGLSFYNFSFLGSSFEEYEYLTDLLLQKTKVKNIILQLSSVEVLNIKLNYMNIYAINSKFSSKLSEIKNILLADCMPKIYNLFRVEARYRSKTKPNGMMEFIENHSPDARDNFTFVDSIRQRWKNLCGNIFFDNKRNIPDKDLVIQSVWRIQNKCLDNNVKLTVLISPNSVYDLSFVESYSFWDFLKNLTEIVPYYNFNGYSAINYNPYNYTDLVHYRKEIGDKMLSIIFGEEEALNDDWGILLTNNNINDYIKRREEKYYEFKKIFEETGSLPFGTIDDASFIPPYGK
jgi:hypothetical protein